MFVLVAGEEAVVIFVWEVAVGFVELLDSVA